MDQIINVAKGSEIKRGWYKSWGTPWGIPRKKTIKYMKNGTNYQKKRIEKQCDEERPSFREEQKKKEQKDV